MTDSDSEPPHKDPLANARNTYLAPNEVARRLGLSERTIWREIAAGRLVVHRFGRATRISHEDLAGYTAQRRHTPLNK